MVEFREEKTSRMMCSLFLTGGWLSFLHRNYHMSLRPREEILLWMSCLLMVPSVGLDSSFKDTSRLASLFQANVSRHGSAASKLTQSYCWSMETLAKRCHWSDKRIMMGIWFEAEFILGSRATFQARGRIQHLSASLSSFHPRAPEDESRTLGDENQRYSHISQKLT